MYRYIYIKWAVTAPWLHWLHFMLLHITRFTLLTLWAILLKAMFPSVRTDPCLVYKIRWNMSIWDLYWLDQELKKSWSENLLSMQFSGHVSQVTTVQSYHQAVTLCCATLALLLLLTRTFPYKTKTLKGNIMFIMSKLHISRQPCYVVALHLLVDTFGQIEATWENEFFFANSWLC